MDEKVTVVPQYKPMKVACTPIVKVSPSTTVNVPVVQFVSEPQLIVDLAFGKAFALGIVGIAINASTEKIIRAARPAVKIL